MFKTMSKQDRQTLFNSLRGSRSQANRPNVRKQPRPRYLSLPKTIQRVQSTPKPSKTIKETNSNVEKMEANMNKFRKRVMLMINTQLLNPREPSFRNEVIANMKNQHANNPNMLPMYNKNWFVNNVVAASYLRGKKQYQKENSRVEISTNPNFAKTKRLMEERRKQMGVRRRGKKVVRESTMPTRKAQRPVSQSNNNKNSNSNNNANKGGFNMNESNRSSVNNNSNRNNSNSNNNKDPMAGVQKPSQNPVKKTTKKVERPKKVDRTKRVSLKKPAAKKNSYSNTVPMSKQQITDLKKNILNMTINKTHKAKKPTAKKTTINKPTKPTKPLKPTKPTKPSMTVPMSKKQVKDLKKNISNMAKNVSIVRR